MSAPTTVTIPNACRGAIAAMLLLLGTTAVMATPVLPDAVRAALPAGHVVRDGTCSQGFDPPLVICVVVAVHRDDGADQEAPPRPLLVYRVTEGRAVLLDRNDDVVLRRDEGGQCDPFDAESGGIAVTDRSFTIENGVACGQHWTDYITFRFDPGRRAFLWRSEIVEQWRLGDGKEHDGNALVPDGGSVRRADPGHPVRLGDYKPRR